MLDMRRLLLPCLFVLCLLAACSPNLQPGSPLELASSTENTVRVDVQLEVDSSGETWLAATFTPLEADTHVYSKDLPRDGLDGLGRPTLVELVPGAPLQVAGALTESVPADEEDVEGLKVYPAGPVILRLPVTLPDGEGWFETNVAVTYMACGNGSCRPPVIGKLIPIRIPGAAEIHTP